MKKIYSCILFWLAAYFSHAQTDTLMCGVSELYDSLDVTTLPYYGNNQFLYDFSDSIDLVYGSFTPEEEFEGGFDGDAYFWIPVKAWVYNDDNGQGGIPESEVRQSIKMLNDYFNGSINEFSQSNGHTNIQFYLSCDITYINDSQMFNGVSNSYNRTIWSNNYESRTFNIHFIRKSLLWLGVASAPNSYDPFSLTILTVEDVHLSHVIAHEVGHCLGLQHTHQYSSYDDPNNPDNLHYDYNRNATPCFQESVSRSRAQATNCHEPGELKCSVTGDLLCDTEADPGLLEGSNVDMGTFTYIGGGSDHWGDPWNPNVFNVMSYGRTGYKNFFSDGQVAVMQYYATRIRNGKPDIYHNNSYVDVYEPDDRNADASEIQLDMPQLRGLHAIPYGSSFTPSFDYCNTDWVKFTIPDTRTVTIITDPVPGSPEVDTKISLLSSGLSILASNDNRNPQDNYSAIRNQTLPAGTYYIKIENEGNTDGKYYLYLNDCSAFCCYQPLATKMPSEINQGTGNFNIGVYTSADETFDKSVDVNGANFGCNINAPIGFGGMGYPNSGSHLELDICNEAEINMIDGDFIIGDPSNNLTAEVTLMSGSSLRLSANAKLTIGEGSKLVIEHGAEFEYFNGAQIELSGPNSALEIKGKVIVGDNAEFTFTGNGRLVFDQLIWPGNEDEFWQIGDNSTFKIVGVDHNHVMMEVKKNFIPRQNDLKKFAWMTFWGGSIEFHPDVEMSIGSPITAVNVRFAQKAGTPDRTHRGLRIWSQDYVTISDCEFANGKIGLTAVRNWAGNTLQLSNCLFENNSIGLMSSGMPVRLTNTVFEKSGSSWYAEAMVGQSEVISCRFSGDFPVNNSSADYAIRFGGQEGSWLRTVNSTFEDSYFGIEITESNLRPECCVFQSLSEAGIIAYSSSVLLNDHATNAFTSAGRSSIIVVNPENQSFFLDDGNNEMFVSGGYNSTLHIEGYFGLNGDLNWAPDAYNNMLISAENNKMQEVSRGNLSGAPVYIQAFPPGAGSLTTMHNVAITNNLPSIDRSSCEGEGPDLPPGEIDFSFMLVQYETGKTIETGNFPGENLKAALLESIGYISGEESEVNDLLAISLLNEILMYAYNPNFDSLTADERSMLNIGYMAMIRALERGYYYEDFEYNDGTFTELIQPLADVVEIIEYRLNNLQPTDPDYAGALYKLHLDKVHVLREGKYYELALQVLSSRSTWASGYDLRRANYWDCVVIAERDWSDGSISDESFFDALSVCIGFLTDTTSGKMSMNSREKWQLPFREESPLIRDENSVIRTFYPNPGSDQVIFELKSPVREGMKVRIADLSGRLLSAVDIHVRGKHSFHVEMPVLQPGTYLLTLVQGESIIETVKWSRE